ncbi:lysozyme [Paenibacillus sp. MER 99-2]|uniref:lysozyme n=1 Tax=Paenibacillus sp. MER 99-2 TaxID=2939572 RepID=UPI00203ED13E|nr:lysozyme [Paenibacillus sp. MER 99-2]MCM3176235.1 lysozyme [Paenibacillus sp. MER 99-2]
MRKISEEGISFIKKHEGVRLTAYKPVKAERFYTIGYGHYGSDVTPNMVITLKQAENILLSDLRKFENFVNNPSYVPMTEILNQNQFDALVSFAFNTGQGNLKKLCGNNRTLKDISEAILLYVNGASGVLQGLVTRRKAERELFLKPVKEDVKVSAQLQKEIDMLNANNKVLTDALNVTIKAMGSMQATIEKLEESVKTITDSSQIQMPEWAKKSVENLTKLGVVNSGAKGSYDFYRNCAMIDRAIRLVSGNN